MSISVNSFHLKYYDGYWIWQQRKTSAIPKEALDVPAVADRCYRFIKQAFGSNVFNPWQLKRLDLNHDLHKLKNLLRCKLFDFCQKKLVLPNSLLRYTVGIVGHLCLQIKNKLTKLFFSLKRTHMFWSKNDR